MKVLSMSFSAHADAKGILNLIKQTDPENVMLVHGEKTKMEKLAPVICDQFPKFEKVFMPANFETCIIEKK